MGRAPRGFFLTTAVVRLTSWAGQLVGFALLGRVEEAECSHGAGSYETKVGDPRCVLCASPVSR